jgi:hypothetical protein
VDVSYPYFGLCLFASSVHKNENHSFFWGLCLLLGWVLWLRRPRRFGIVVWVSALGMAICFGYVGARSIGYFQRYVDTFNVQLLARLLGRGHTDPTRSQTQIGEIGRIETSTAIVIRLQPRSGEFPTYLREASYRNFRSQTWTANRFGTNFLTVDHAPTNENTWPLGLVKTNASCVGIACYLTEWDPASGYPSGVLPLPSGSVRLENLPAYILKKNLMGAVVADGPGLVQFDTFYGPGATVDSPPETNVVEFFNPNPDATGFGAGVVSEGNGPPAGYGNGGGGFRGPGRNLSRMRGTDLQIPTNEIPALDQIVDELKLRNQSYDDALKNIGQFFATKFTYRMWQDTDNAQETNATPLSRFLLSTHAGHCEYFATATVLLLRDLGIPARYAVGYSVHESGFDGYVVRQRDSHAWCLAWNEEKKIWEDFDTTPGTGLEAERRGASLWISNAQWWVRFQFSRFRWGQTHLRDYILVGLVPVLGLLLFQIVRQRRRRGLDKSVAGRRKVVWPGLDSEFYQIEKQLADRGIVRGLNEPLVGWLERAAREPSLAALKSPLRALLHLHYRYRFDPAGLSDADRGELRRAARECLAILSRTEVSTAA